MEERKYLDLLLAVWDIHFMMILLAFFGIFFFAFEYLSLCFCIFSFLLCIFLSPWGSGQRESFFQSRDENESFSDSILFIETRPRIPDTYSQASRRDREKISSNLGHQDEIEFYYLHSQTSRRERVFP